MGAVLVSISFAVVGRGIPKLDVFGNQLVTCTVGLASVDFRIRVM